MSSPRIIDDVAYYPGNWRMNDNAYFAKLTLVVVLGVIALIIYQCVNVKDALPNVTPMAGVNLTNK